MSNKRKLTPKEVKEIKYLIVAGEKIKTIANLYRVSSHTLINILR